MAEAELLVGTFDDTGGYSVLRYDETTHAPILTGRVATGDHGLGAVQGLAVAPDGSFYVSSIGNGAVHHYDGAGNFLGFLGAGDSNPAPLFAPGRLAFGPNGHLYVTDLGLQAILQFDTASNSQQFQVASSVFLNESPGGFTFAPDASGDLIVGLFDTQSVVRIANNSMQTTLVGFGSGINPLEILAEPNGNLLIADADLGFEPFGHHQVVRYDSATHALGQVVNLTSPVGTGAADGYAPQPTSLSFDRDGNLLIGVSPDHNLNGAIVKFDFGNSQLTTLVSNIGTPTGLALIGQVPEPSTIVLAIVGAMVLVAARIRTIRGRRL